jgi:hypothetical protein
MGKIFRALRRSGNSFDQNSISKRTIRENAQISLLERRALSGYDNVFDKRKILKNSINENRGRLTLLNNIDSRLKVLGLGKDQISKQSLKELNKSLQRIDGYISNPESIYKQKYKHNANSEIDFKLSILPILLERKMFTLESFNELVSKKKILNLRRLTKKISDKSVKSSIDKIIDDLQIKDSIIKKEYQKLEKLRLYIYSDQQKLSSIFEELRKFRKRSPKFARWRGSMTRLMTGILLILITFFMVAAPFANIQIPNILNSTFLIILGFFFGQTIGIGRVMDN